MGERVYLRMLSIMGRGVSRQPEPEAASHHIHSDKIKQRMISVSILVLGMLSLLLLQDFIPREWWLLRWMGLSPIYHNQITPVTHV